MNIYPLLTEDTVLPQLKVNDKEELLNRLIDLFRDRVEESQLESIRKAVFDREEIMSTGVGKGLAIPHGKAADIDKSYASFALLSEPVDYGSIDDKPVNLVFLLVGPETKNSMHIKLLSRISRLMNSASFRKKLEESQTAEEILQCFEEEERQFFKT